MQFRLLSRQPLCGRIRTVSIEEGGYESISKTRRLRAYGDGRHIRHLAASHAFDLLRRRLLDLPL